MTNTNGLNNLSPFELPNLLDSPPNLRKKGLEYAPLVPRLAKYHECTTKPRETYGGLWAKYNALQGNISNTNNQNFNALALPSIFV